MAAPVFTSIATTTWVVNEEERGLILRSLRERTFEMQNDIDDERGLIRNGGGSNQQIMESIRIIGRRQSKINEIDALIDRLASIAQNPR